MDSSLRRRPQRAPVVGELAFAARLGSPRQDDAEARSTARRITDVDRAPVGLDRAARQREPEPEADPAPARRGAAVERLERRPASFFELHEVIAQTPALRRRLLEQRDGWRAAFAHELLERADAARNDLTCELLATAALGAFDVATETWARTGGRRRLGKLVDESFELLGSGLAGP